MQNETTLKGKHFIEFKKDVTNVELPKKFTFPFYYEPHPLAIVAANELQEYLKNQNDFDHNFGLVENKDGIPIGKMFGVLVVEDKNGAIGYLTAFSGKLAGKNNHSRFVPPVFDMLTEGSFFREGEVEINAINLEIEELENSSKYKSLISKYENAKKECEAKISEMRADMREAKKVRKQKRKVALDSMSNDDYKKLCDQLAKESVNAKIALRNLMNSSEKKIELISIKVSLLNQKISRLKELRSSMSAKLQNKLFDNYSFLNRYGESKSLAPIFENTASRKPPAGAGECAAPKLLNYAFKNKLKPISMAEFWWGVSPSADVRKHGQFYPACIGKCQPILKHMLKGIEMDENPMLVNPAIGKTIDIVFEDEFITIINKPAEFLSVPGKHIQDSVYTRIKKRYPTATGPLLVHRLDMSTSGLMVIAKDKNSHKYLQRQFIKRTIDKRYTALLDGYLKIESGVIDLPLRLDLDDRPRQLVCFEHGKIAQTKWEIIERKSGSTRVNFYPITGRTHQLRVHAAHPNGLNMPIIGDDLYGKRDKRLHLHATYISFKHPKTKSTISFELEAEF
ncbi:MAG: RluA family pseudouridine synthase [Brumimicrobium sp.]